MLISAVLVISLLFPAQKAVINAYMVLDNNVIDERCHIQVTQV